MKRIIKLIIITIILFIPLWMIFDNTIIKSIIIKASQKATQKETYLKKVDISYFPNLKLKLIEFKLPNPMQNNYVLTAKELSIEINTNALLKKSLVIENITSNKAILFDASKTPNKIIQKTKSSNNENEPSKINELIKKSVSKSLQMFNEREIKESQEEKFNFKEENQTIDDIIETTTQLTNEKKDVVLNKTNGILYEINSININSINNANQLNEAKKSIEKINEKHNEVLSEINAIESIYLTSEETINEMSNKVVEKANNAFKFEIVGNEDSPSASILTTPSKTVIDFFIRKLTRKKQDAPSEKTKGKTYVFNTKKQPRFLLKKVEINSFEDAHYLKGLNLTLSKIITDELKLYVKLINQPKFEKFILNINSLDKTAFNFNSRFRNMNLAQTKLYENEEVIVNFLNNKKTNIDLTGTLSATSNIDISIEIKDPKYRVINKQTTNHLLSEFIPYLNDQELRFLININGTREDYAVNTQSNLDPLIKNLQTSILNKKISRLKKQKEKEIDLIKKSELEKINAKKTAFNETSKKVLTQLKFQSNEIETQKRKIERQVNQKRNILENEVKNKVEDSIKKIKFN